MPINFLEINDQRGNTIKFPFHDENNTVSLKDSRMVQVVTNQVSIQEGRTQSAEERIQQVDKRIPHVTRNIRDKLKKLLEQNIELFSETPGKIVD